MARTEIVDPHGVVVGLRGELPLGEFPDLRDHWVVRREADVPRQERTGLVNVGPAGQ